MNAASTLNEMLVDRVVKKVTSYLDKIEELEMKMSDIWDKHGVLLNEEARQSDTTKSDEYQLEVTSKLTSFRQAVSNKSEDNDASNQDIVDALSKG